ncbi:MAG: citrate transporter [Parasporobacterium sp.]|nr:citrate transporter [Parasporobacterium sp.]
MKKVIAFVKKEVVLCAAAVLAIISAFLVPPDAAYTDYIDWRTLAILFCLMAVMAGLRKIGVFHSIAEGLLAKAGSVRSVMMVLVMLCFFSSMIITNDVALITFVPLTITVLKMMGNEHYTGLLIPVIVMQTIAANLGSMLTPIGNPQNLYLYGQSGMGFGSFILLMLPYCLLSLAGLIVWILIKGRRCTRKDPSGCVIKSSEGFTPGGKNTIRLAAYLLMFVLCLLTVVRVVPWWIVLIIIVLAVIATDFRILGKVDYCLLLTFAGFFIFIGNMGRIPAVHDFIAGIVAGREVITSVVSSQVISNVPAALLLSGFTDNYTGLITGTNLGGLGTIIASMASLISFKYAAAEPGVSKGKYLLHFTIANVVFLAGLLIMWLVIGQTA